MNEQDLETIEAFLRKKVGPDTYTEITLTFRAGRLRLTRSAETEVYDDVVDHRTSRPNHQRVLSP